MWSMKASKHFNLENRTHMFETNTLEAGLDLDLWHLTAWTCFKQLYEDLFVENRVCELCEMI